MTIEQLRDRYEKTQKAAAVHRKRIEVLEKGFNRFVEKYLDRQLKDKNGRTVKVNDFISNGKKTLRVVDRATQFVFGTVMDNPRVWVIPVETVSKSKQLFRNDLKEWEVVSGT